MPIDPRIPLGVQPPQQIDLTRGMVQGAQLARMRAITEQEQAEMALKRREVAEQEQIRAVLQESQGDLEAALPKIRQIAPMTALKIEQVYTDSQAAKLKLTSAKLDHDLQQTEYIARQLSGVTDQQSYDYARAAIAGAGLSVEGMNPTYSPEYIEGLKAKGLSIKEQLDLKKAEADRLFQERKFQAERQETLRDDERADKQFARQAASDEARIGIDRARLGLERQRVALAQQEAGAAVPKSDAELIEAILANPAIYADLTPTIKSRLAGPLAKRGFKQFATTPGQKAGGPNVGAILGEIETLSKRINTQSMGPGSNIAGWVRKGAAAGNLDNDVAEYESLVTGMIPMVARAVGHTGVLTQQDVDSVRNLFPKATDNAALAKNKIERVKLLLAGTGVAVPPSSGVAAVAEKKNPFRK